MTRKQLKQLEAVYEKLVLTYPLRHMKIDCVIRHTPLYETTNDCFVCDRLHQGKAEATIFLFYDKNLPLSPTDEWTLKTYRLRSFELPFWYLCHEYGHVMALDERIDTDGIQQVAEWLDSVEETTKSLQMRQKEIDNPHIVYKQLPSEKEADLFAKKIYMDTVKEFLSFFHE